MRFLNKKKSRRYYYFLKRIIKKILFSYAYKNQSLNSKNMRQSSQEEILIFLYLLLKYKTEFVMKYTVKLTFIPWQYIKNNYTINQVILNVIKYYLFIISERKIRLVTCYVELNCTDYYSKMVTRRRKQREGWPVGGRCWNGDDDDGDVYYVINCMRFSFYPSTYEIRKISYN